MVLNNPGMNNEHIKNENPQKDTNTNSNAFYVFGGLTFISGIWSLIGNFYDPELISVGVWLLDTTIALVGLVFIIFQYKLNNTPSNSNPHSTAVDKEKFKSSPKPKSKKMPYKKISLIDLQSNKLT